MSQDKTPKESNLSQLQRRNQKRSGLQPGSAPRLTPFGTHSRKLDIRIPAAARNTAARSSRTGASENMHGLAAHLSPTWPVPPSTTKQTTTTPKRRTKQAPTKTKTNPLITVPPRGSAPGWYDEQGEPIPGSITVIPCYEDDDEDTAVARFEVTHRPTRERLPSSETQAVR